jgi:hypothetical protein
MGMFDDLLATPPPGTTRPAAPQAAGMFDDMLAPPPEAPPQSGTARSLQVGAQGTGRGLADLAGAPFDLMALAMNAGLSGVDLIAEAFGGDFNHRVEKPFLGSDWIAEKSGQAAEMIPGVDLIDPEDMAWEEKLGYGVSRFGTSAVTGGTALAKSAGKNAPAVIDALSAPYAKNPASTVVGDTMAGVGTGTADALYDRLVPEEDQGPIGRLIANIFGGIGGATGAAMGGAVKDIAVNKATNAGKFLAGSPDVPPNAIDPATGQPFSRSAMDRAARVAQDVPTNRSQATQTIRDNMDEFKAIGSGNPTEMPTTALLADDLGMAIDENNARLRNSKDFNTRDNARRALAAERAKASAPADADPKAMTNQMDQTYDSRLAVAEKDLQKAEGHRRGAQMAVDKEQARLNELQKRQGENSANLAQEYTDQRIASQAARSEAYNSVPKETPVDSQAVADAVESATAPSSEYARVNASGDQAGGAVMGKIRNRLYQATEDGDVLRDDLTYGDITDMITDISEEIDVQVTSGRSPRQLKALRSDLQEVQNRLNPDAAAAAADHRARFKTGKSGEYNAAQKRAAKTGNESSATRPSEFAGQFMGKSEDAASLQRAIDVNGNEVTAANARDWMLGDMAKAGLSRDGVIRADRFRQWAEKNKAVIDQFPSIRKQVDAEIRRAARAGKISQSLTRQVEQAKTNLKKTKSDLDQSVWSTQRGQGGRSPQKTVEAIMNSGDPERQMDELVRGMRTQESKNGLKAAVRDWIIDKANTTGKLQGDPESARLSRAALNRLMTKHEKTLTKIYSPKEMNALRQAQKLLDVEGLLQTGATGGSNTADKFFSATKAASDRRWRILEGTLKARFGVLKGGGILRTLRVFASTLPDGVDEADRIVSQMYLDPELAVHLLERPVKDLDTPQWNKNLNRILSAASAGRESGKSDE